MDNNTNVVTNEQEQKIIKGYKVFNFDWTCRGFQYEVGKTYSLDLKEGEKLKCCKNGFHFCTDLKDCFYYYAFDFRNKVAEIEVLGNVETGNFNDTKMCTDKIKIIKELYWNEVLDMINDGKENTGIGNKGGHNSGHYNYGGLNKGDFNYGYRNEGSYNNGSKNYGTHNVGNFNKGFKNVGDCNTGYYNIGDYNLGDFNIGNNNISSFNKCDYSTGSFCTTPTTYYLFNKPSIWTYKQWVNSEAYGILLSIAPRPVEWIHDYNMTNEEKKEHPEYVITGGYLKVRTDEEMRCEWKNNWNYLLGKKDRKIIMNIPNFDPDIFEEITGIKVDMSKLNDNN